MKLKITKMGYIATAVVAFVLLHACDSHNKIEKENAGEMIFSKTIRLQLDSLLNSDIKAFYPLYNDGYVLTDGTCIYKLDSVGNLTKRIHDQGHAKKEYLKIGNLFSDGKYIYAWCEVSFFLYKYDMDLNYIDKFQGPNRAIKQFVVANNDTAYFLLTGGFDETISVVPLNHNSKPKYCECYTNEDKALLRNSASGGITIMKGRIKYVRPSSMNILTLNDDVTWALDDKDFKVKPIGGNLQERSHKEMWEYILSNSTCTGLYSNGEHLWLITETGAFSTDSNGVLSIGNRHFNIFKINESGDVISSTMYNYPQIGKYLIQGDCLYSLLFDGSSYKIQQHML